MKKSSKGNIEEKKKKTSGEKDGSWEAFGCWEDIGQKTKKKRKKVCERSGRKGKKPEYAIELLNERSQKSNRRRKWVMVR